MTYENYRADTKKGGRKLKEKINVKLHRLHRKKTREKERQGLSGTARGRQENKRTRE